MNLVAAVVLVFFIREQETKIKLIEFMNVGQNAAGKAVEPDVEPVTSLGPWRSISFLCLLNSFVHLMLGYNLISTVVPLIVGISMPFYNTRVVAMNHGSSCFLPCSRGNIPLLWSS